MIVILLEALLALLLLVLIVWWTMFSGRRNGELPDSPTDRADSDPASPQPASRNKEGKPGPPR